MLSAQASTGTGLSYQWANNSGLTLLPNQDRAIVSAPQGVKAGKHEIMLTVTDNKGQTAQASHAITVKAMENGVVLPQANITGGTELTIAAAQGLVLSGKSSSGSQLRFTWSNASGLGLQANGDQVLVRAPQNTKPGNHEVKLLVTDNKGNTAQSTHALRVKAAETGGTEGDIADYRPGVSYKAGDKVKNVGKVFQCKPMPYSAWCGQSAAHYAPGTGSAWGRLGRKLNNQVGFKFTALIQYASYVNTRHVLRSLVLLRACSKSLEQERDKAKTSEKRNVQVVHQHFEAVLTVSRFATHSRL